MNLHVGLRSIHLPLPLDLDSGKQHKSFNVMSFFHFSALTARGSLQILTAWATPTSSLTGKRSRVISTKRGLRSYALQIIKDPDCRGPKGRPPAFGNLSVVAKSAKPPGIDSGLRTGWNF